MKLNENKDRVGNVIKIKLNESSSGLARVIGGSFLEFYDVFLSDSQPNFDCASITQYNVIFTLSVHKSWTKNSGWQLIGSNSSAIPNPPRQFMQSIGNPNDIKIVDPTGGMIPSTRQQVELEGLERVAVWEDGHIEDRLRDYSSGKPNVWMDQLKLK